MPIPQVEALDRVFMRDNIYRSLRKWIVEGNLTPGEQLKDKELAAQLGVSRTPVRESLRKLEDEGLVETAANRWTRVSPIAIEDAERIYPVVQKLEELALTLAFSKLSASHVQKMTAANERLRQVLESNDILAAVQADESFHQTLIDVADNAELSALLKQLKTKYKRIELAYFSEANLLSASFEEHRALILAIEDKDLDAAIQALSSNWQASIERLKELGD